MRNRLGLRAECCEVTGEELYLLPEAYRHFPSGGPLWAGEADAELLLHFVQELRRVGLVMGNYCARVEVDEFDRVTFVDVVHWKISFRLRQSGRPAEGQAGTLSAAKQPAEPAEGSPQEQETHG